MTTRRDRIVGKRTSMNGPHSRDRQPRLTPALLKQTTLLPSRLRELERYLRATSNDPCTCSRGGLLESPGRGCCAPSRKTFLQDVQSGRPTMWRPACTSECTKSVPKHVTTSQLVYCTSAGDASACPCIRPPPCVAVRKRSDHRHCAAVDSPPLCPQMPRQWAGHAVPVLS